MAELKAEELKIQTVKFKVTPTRRRMMLLFSHSNRVPGVTYTYLVSTNRASDGFHDPGPLDNGAKVVVWDNPSFGAGEIIAVYVKARGDNGVELHAMPAVEEVPDIK